ncbi:hypothetical protein UlMin_005734 [Ulmus minor]
MNAQVLFAFTFTLLLAGTNAAKVTIKTNCPRTIWPATQISGEQQLSTTGFELASGASNTIDVPPPWNGRFFSRKTRGVTFWARTRCTTNAVGKFTCGTSDCGSDQVSCNGLSGAPPTTLVEINFQPNGGQDFYDVSNVDGFNIPTSVVPKGGNGDCKPLRCTVNINAVCKPKLQVKTAEGEVIGCKSACAAFGDPKYCCTGDFNKPETYPSTDYSRFFEEQCPEAYIYAYDDKNSTFTCFGGPNYITFCS